VTAGVSGVVGVDTGTTLVGGSVVGTVATALEPVVDVHPEIMITPIRTRIGIIRIWRFIKFPYKKMPLNLIYKYPFAILVQYRDLIEQDIVVSQYI
jgi:hypothetical protein